MRHLALVLASALAIGTSASAQSTINVNPGDSIQTAIDAAAPGDTIIVADGTYNENLNVNKALTLVSTNGKDNVTIQGSEAQSAALGGGNLGTVCISAIDTSIGTSETDGFTIIGYDVANPGIEHAAIYLKSSASTGVAIIGNDIVADGEAGITSEYGSTQGIEIAYNEFSGKTYVGTTVGGNSSVQFTVHNVPRSMIYFGGNCTNISFHHNTVGGSVGGVIGAGPDTYYNTGATIDCKGATDLASGAQITDNIFTVPSWAALRARGHYSTITDNTFDASGAGGLAVGTYYENTTNDVYSGNTYISGPGEMFLGGDGASTTEFPGDYADYDVVWLETASGTFLRVTGTDRTGTLAYQQTISFDDQSLTVAGLSVPTVRMVPSVHATIPAAVAASSDGDTIMVEAGSYSESITLTKSLTLLGANAGIHPAVGTHPTETAGTRGPETIITGKIYPQADDITIDGFTIDSGTGTRVIDTYADANAFEFRNNIFLNSSAYAPQGVIQFGGGSHTDCVFEFNSFQIGETSMLYTGGVFDRLLIQYNRINCEGDAVFWTADPLVDGVIKGNEIDGTIGGTPGVGYCTFNIGQAGNLSIEDNWIHDVHYTAFQVGMIGGQVLNNTFENTYPYSSDPALYGGYDLYFWGGAWGTALSTNNEIAGNTFRYDNSAAGPVRAIRLAGPANAGDPAIDASTFDIHDNKFIGGGAYAGTPSIRHQGDQSTTVTAYECYWGTPTPVVADLIEGNGSIPSYYTDEAMTNLVSGETWVDDDYDAMTPGWGLDHFDNIQDAIAHTLAAGTVNVAAGTYAETGQIVIDKDLTVTGAGIGTTIVSPTANTGSSGDSRGWWLVEASVSLDLSDLTLDGTGFDVYQGIRIKGGGSVERVAFTEMKHPGYSGVGIAAFGDLNLDVSDSTFDEMGRIGVLYFGAGITGSSFTGNTYTGKGDGDWIDYCLDISSGAVVVVDNNTISDCTGVASSDGSVSSGILVSTYYGGGTNATITNNTISGCSSGVHVGYNGSDTSTVTIEDNNLAGNVSGVVGTIPADATRNYWGAADGPSGEGPGSGSAAGTGIAYSPWWTTAAMDTLAYDSGTFGDYTVERDETLDIPATLTITGGTFLVDGGTLNAGEVDLQNDAVLNVVDGQLTIGDSTLAGSFTFFNSFGSVDFNGDVAISGSAEGLILVCDVHVADGATITVDGTLIIDGCVVDSDGSYSVVVNSGASFTMARTVMVNAAVSLSADESKLYDNRFVTSTINVTTGTTGAQVYHNILDNQADLSDAGTGTVTSVDGWANLTDPAATINNLVLNLDLGTLTDPGSDRTDDAGDVYIQPADPFTGTIDVSDLGAKIAAAEMLLGYSTDFLAASTLSPGTNWSNPIVEIADTSTVIGKLDAAIGLSFSYPDADGTQDDQALASVTLTAKALEGETVFFHRVKLASDSFGGDTRLTTGGPSPAFLAPFSANSGTVTIDGSAPTIDEASVDGTQVQASSATPVDVLDPAPTPPPAQTFRNGNPVILTFTATDAGPAGIDISDLDNDLVLAATNGTTTLDSSNYTVTATEDAAGLVSFTLTLDIPDTATNGTYAVAATLLDRSGNLSVTADLGEFLIANELLATVELENFVGGPRDVTFVATDAAGTVLASWLKTVEFTAAIGSVGLENVPATTANISAKTDWNLRSKVAATFTPEGIGSADLTAADLLPGGDITGDNVVNTLDYSVMRYHWLTTDPTADINGDGQIQTLDYLLLKDNFYTAGDDE